MKEALENLIEIKSGHSPSTFKLMPCGVIPYVKVEDMNNCAKYQTSSREYCEDIARSVPKGSIIFPKRGAAIMNNKVRITAVDICMDTNMMAIIPNESIESEFLYYTIGHEKLSRIADTSTIPQINNKHINPYKITVPPLPEQKAIADLLSTWDEAIEKTERLIQAKEKQFGWLLRELISEPRNTQKDAKWKKVKLGEAGTPYSGLTSKNKDDFGAGKPYLPYLNVYQNFRVSTTQLDYVSIRENENQKLVQKGDVFFTVSSETADEVGISSVLLEDLGECYLNSFCFGWRPSSQELSSEYLQFYFRSAGFREQMKRLAQGATRFNLSKTELMKAYIRFPPLGEQQQISETLSSTQQEITLLKHLAEKYKTQKRGLMQKMLTGIWRIKPEIINQYTEV